MKHKIILIGASVRAAAFSALRAGLEPICIDLFADSDLQNRCPTYQISSLDSTDEIAQCLAGLPRAPTVCAGGMENYPEIVEQFMDFGTVWGNSHDVLRRVRDPVLVQEALRNHGLPSLDVSLTPPEEKSPKSWLRKPIKGSGGAGISHWKAGERHVSGYYYQEFVEQFEFSVCFLSDGSRCRPLGVTHQIHSNLGYGPERYRYAGNISDARVGENFSERKTNAFYRICKDIGDALASEFNLVGLFGVDLVLSNEKVWAVEVNPRYPASLENIEYATGYSAFAQYPKIFGKDPRPCRFSPGPNRYVIGKEILYTDLGLEFPANGPWMREIEKPADVHEMPEFADIPAPGTEIGRGQPIMTVFMKRDSLFDCEVDLRRKMISTKNALGGTT